MTGIGYCPRIFVTLLISEVICSLSVNPSTCSSAGSDKWATFFNKRVITLQPGSPCNDFKGYCDVFMRCRLVDADGPLARLKKAIFNAELYETIAEWIVVSVSRARAIVKPCCYDNINAYREPILYVSFRLTGGQCC